MIALIAEKPSVAKDIARIIGATQRNDGYLSGNGYMVTWAFGHLIQLAMPEAYGVANFRRVGRKHSRPQGTGTYRGYRTPVRGRPALHVPHPA